MKLILLSFILSFFIANISYTQKKPCCDDEGTTETKTTSAADITAPNVMASFGSDESFKNEHPQPLEFTLRDGAGSMVTYKTPDGTDAYGYEVKSASPTNNWVLVFHEWYGLNDYVKKEAEEIAVKLGNVNVLAVDLYDGKVAANNDEAVKYVQSVDNARALNIIAGARDYAGTSAVFATVGWCFGGAWSLQAAIELGSRCNACVIYYGMPEQNMERLALLKAPVLGIFANKDTKITPEVVAKFETDLKSLNIPASIFEFEANHGFANPSNPKHDAAATEEAKEKTYAFLKEKMK
jgi:carboxymethylenebutenolidase